jgi:hypothetical protein
MAWASDATMDSGDDRCRFGPSFDSSPEGEAGNLLTEGCLYVHPSGPARIRPSNLRSGFAVQFGVVTLKGWICAPAGHPVKFPQTHVDTSAVREAGAGGLPDGREGEGIGAMIRARISCQNGNRNAGNHRQRVTEN